MRCRFEIDEDGDLRGYPEVWADHNDWVWMDREGHIRGLTRSLMARDMAEIAQQLDNEARCREYGPYARKLPTPPEGFRWYKNTVSENVITDSMGRSWWVPSNDSGIRKRDDDHSDIPIEVARCLLEEYDSRPKSDGVKP